MPYTKNKFKDFCIKIKAKYPEEDLTVLEYHSAKEPARIQCNKCGTIFTLKNGSNFLEKSKKKVCNVCIPRKDTQEVGQKIEYVLKNTDKITLLNHYTKITDDLELQCNICGGHFKRKPQLFLKTQKCPLCETKSVFKTKEVFEWELQNTYGDEYTLLGDYESTTTRTTFRHNTCGFIFSVSPRNILCGKSGCPKCRRFSSKGEMMIRNILTRNNIPFEEQKRFSKLSKLLSFDFYLPKYNTLIEYQGEQHYKVVPHFGGEARFQQQQINDEKKRVFCKQQGINFIEIKYTDYDNIEDILSPLWFNDYPKGVALNKAK